MSTRTTGSVLYRNGSKILSLDPSPRGFGAVDNFPNRRGDTFTIRKENLTFLMRIFCLGENMGNQERTQKCRQEYDRIREIFKESDPELLEVMDGVIWEAARCRAELDELHEIVAKSGLILVDRKNPLRQKELPVSRQLVRVRASYLNHMTKLAKVFGQNAPEDDDLGLDEYE